MTSEMDITKETNKANKEIAAATNQANKDIAQMNNDFNLNLKSATIIKYTIKGRFMSR